MNVVLSPPLPSISYCSTLTKWPRPTDLVESWEASHATGALLQLSGTDSHSLSQSLGLGPNIMKTFFSSLNVLPEGLASSSPGQKLGPSKSRKLHQGIKEGKEEGGRNPRAGYLRTFLYCVQGKVMV